MNRSIRRAPVYPITGAHSDKPFKRRRRWLAARLCSDVGLQDGNHLGVLIRVSEAALQTIGATPEACGP